MFIVSSAPNNFLFCNSFAYCYHSVNVISFSLSQSDHIKRLPLYKVLIYELSVENTKCLPLEKAINSKLEKNKWHKPQVQIIQCISNYFCVKYRLKHISKKKLIEEVFYENTSIEFREPNYPKLFTVHLTLYYC